MEGGSFGRALIFSMVYWSLEIGSGFGTGRAAILLVIACSVLDIHLICGSTVVPDLEVPQT